MAINYIPNDPVAALLNTPRREAARPNRSSSRARFTLASGIPQGVFDSGTPEFLHWQTREAALNALAMWETIAPPVTRWARSSDPRLIDLVADAGEDLNAYYDGESVTFFHFQTGAKTTFSGASTDVVAHECGHALLDVIRPDLWSVNTIEAGAFHEAFGDCVALLTALRDRPTRVALLAATKDLSKANFLEATAEDLSDGVLRAIGASHPASKPRRALNTFQYTLPSLLPANGGPDALTSEVHSFGRIFSGCFYDVIRLLYTNGSRRGQAALWSTAQRAGKLLVAGAQNARVTSRFFQSVGQAMVLADESLFAGANRGLIRDAFRNHSVELGAAALLAPRAALAGRAPRVTKTARIPPDTSRDLRRRLGAGPGTRVETRAIQMGSLRAAEVVSERDVSLGSVDPRLRGVVAVARASVIVGSANRRAVMLGAAPDPINSENEVRAFVEMLIATGDLAFERNAKKAVRGAVRTSGKRKPSPGAPTHAIKAVRGKRMIVRERFACGTCGCRIHSEIASDG